eukprot:5287173-Prymnesium_polylepis.1
MEGKLLVTFMCDGVAAAIQKEWFWQGLARLKREYGMEGKLLATFMSNSVAAAIEKQGFRYTGAAYRRRPEGDESADSPLARANWLLQKISFDE